MSGKTLYQKLWNKHRVTTLATGQDQIFIGLHLIHEVTTPQAFAQLNESGKKVAFPERTFATLDHIVPTKSQARPYQDQQAEVMATALETNIEKHGIKFFGPDSNRQGIVHVIGPELGLTQPGMTVACGDSHTSTHGAFGSLGFGIGTTEVGLVLATQTLALSPFKVRRITVNGTLKAGVFSKDVILKIIQTLGVKGGIGFAYEFGGTVFDVMTMEERMSVCNMSIEGGARIGYVNPDQTTFDYLEGREFSPKGEAFEKAKIYWASIASDPDARYDDVVQINGDELEPMVTWGITPGQSVGVSENIPTLADLPEPERKVAAEAFAHMEFKPGAPITSVPINMAFIGSCTNSRISDLREAAKILASRKVHSDVTLLVVPGSQQVKAQAEAEGLHKTFTEAGAEWREPGCSMCLAMNPDKLIKNQICASSSNRNFIGRQGSPTGRTLLMSPAMVAAAAIVGHVTDVRALL
ncbi:MAG: 3-isopropylmalate/(R)-2-methylmalate dehydratase large subunit [Candidatus Marinamargulisbacteria bacterium]|jgi:3-isopropylmalate/(R)-2-methylmalate dehydratase large subunit